MPNLLLPTSASQSAAMPPGLAGNDSDAPSVPFADVLRERLPERTGSPRDAGTADATAAPPPTGSAQAAPADAGAAPPREATPADAAAMADAAADTTATEANATDELERMFPALANWIAEWANGRAAPATPGTAAISDAPPAISAALPDVVPANPDASADDTTDDSATPVPSVAAGGDDPEQAANLAAAAPATPAAAPVVAPAGAPSRKPADAADPAPQASPVATLATTLASRADATDTPPAGPPAEPPGAAIAAVAKESPSASPVATKSDDGGFAAALDRANGQATLAHNGQHPGSGSVARAESSTVLHQPAGTTAWQNALGDRLVWMANTQRAQADLVLNPPQLGRVEVSLTVAGDQASAVFGSPNAAVREMIEDSLPRLREILAGAGIQLGDANVNSGSSQDQANANGAGPGDNRGRDSTLATAAERSGTVPLTLTATGWRQGGSALVDTFV